MPRVLLLLPTTTYRTKAFIEAALKLGVDVVAASDERNALADKNPTGLITLDFLNPESAARDAKEFAEEHFIDAIIAVDEDTAITAAAVAREINVRHNSVKSTITAKNKHQMRETLSRAKVQVPRFWHFSLDLDPREMATRVTFPCVVKPVFLSTSRGVMRADNEEEFAGVIARLERILSDPKTRRRGGSSAREALVEEFIPGFEVAVEGLVTDGRFRPLAIFDKPDPLDGPFFEETIYVTPSRLDEAVQLQIIETTASAIKAMGLERGPVHAELRVNEGGAWVIEVAARAIGGLCSRALKFDGGASLEELIIRHALGEDVSRINREAQAAGVMMIPIPRAGILKEVIGVSNALLVPNIENVVITAHTTQKVAPPPEGASYIGFIFSRAASPERAEAALREAHSQLEFIIDPAP
jgi:biotin carboxylase